MGIVDMRGDLGRIHGSVGLAIQRPRLTVKAAESSETIITGARSSRASETLGTLMSEHGVTSGVKVEILEDIPEHTGFGSGTQLTLALGTILSKLFDLGLTPQSIAERMGRSRVSGIGTYAYLCGGFIVDGGHALDRRDSVPPLVFRRDFPEDWVLVVGVPRIKRGVSGNEENDAFKRLEPPPAETVAEVSRVVLIQMIPSIIEGDIERFGDAMTKLDSMFGDYWLKVQGGRYSHPRIEEGVNYLLEKGALGAGQSSWGPAFYGLADGEAKADNLARGLSRYLNTVGEGLAFTTKVDNLGAQVSLR
jgi:beta-ribofuranosylaminobenzene 5'-phosphate synthase